jgi:hypothetical protein
VTSRQALAFVRKHGVVLEAAAGPVPSFARAVVGGPIRGSWWAHPRSQEIFDLTRSMRDSPDVLVCRVVDGKITYVHRRLWPALARVAERFPRKRLARVRETHAASGQHATEEVPFSSWLPAAVARDGASLSEAAAHRALGPWCT